MSRLLAADKGAPCRVGRRVYEAGCVVRAGRREGVGQRWRKRRAQGGRARAERTWNMYFTVVTLDVSKLSGWLNAVAACRVERRAYDAVRDAGREVGGLGAMAAQAACRGGRPTKGCGDQGTRGAH
eukprot:scaffold14907_cov60-Phaeocystis_antarctica.AAC.1